jgi:hypothetical protein
MKSELLFSGMGEDVVTAHVLAGSMDVVAYDIQYQCDNYINETTVTE